LTCVAGAAESGAKAVLSNGREIRPQDGQVSMRLEF
jgi:hypothetical protein